MNGTAEFQIIGRIGKIAKLGGVLKINIASDYPSRADDGTWNDNTHWNTVTIFNEQKVASVEAKSKPGDIVSAQGRIRNASYEKNGSRVYTVDLIATRFSTLAANAPSDPKLVDEDDDESPF